MSSLHKSFVLFTALIAVYSCSPIHTSFEYNKRRDYSVYKKYAWLTENIVLDVADGLMTLNLPGNKVINQVDEDFREKGFNIDPFSPHFLILVHMGLNEKVTVKDKGSSGYGNGKLKIEIEAHPEGTVFMDVIDAKSFDLVWRGTAIKETEDNPTKKTMQKNVLRAVDKLLDGFPPES